MGEIGVVFLHLSFLPCEIGVVFLHLSFLPCELANVCAILLPKLGSEIGGGIGVVFLHLSFLLFFLFEGCVKFLLMPVNCRDMGER